jgi:hypothetical protein
MCRSPASSAGTTTRVRDCGGMPAEKSIRGSGLGPASELAKRFTSATASWLKASSAVTAISRSIQPRAPPACAPSSRPAAGTPLARAIAVRYSSSACRRPAPRTTASSGSLTRAAASSCARPVPIR